MPNVRVADYVAQRLVAAGIRDVFSVTGGAAMHLNDAFAAQPGLDVHYMHHEQACAIAAEGYARVDWTPAAVCVTAGPGVLNALTGVFGAFTDSIPMVVVSGQSRSDTLLTTHELDGALRQLGDQEVPTAALVTAIVKRFVGIRSVSDVQRELDEALLACKSGRPGPVWIEIPVDVQAQQMDTDAVVALVEETQRQVAQVDIQAWTQVRDLLLQADRPVILAGTGVRAAGVQSALQELSEIASVPVLTAWTHDIFDNESPLFAGRPGTIGTRAGNLVLQAADVLVVLGSRLNIRQISYNWGSFAEHAKIVQIDVDEAELRKPFPHIGIGVKADLSDFLPWLAQSFRVVQAPLRAEWIAWVGDIRARFEPAFSDYRTSEAGINPYHFVMEVDKHLSDDLVVCGNAAACIVPFQVLRMTGKRRMFSNSGAASMGYDLPAALGASRVDPTRRIVCFAGDGSIMMNIQELQTLLFWAPNLKLLILDNGGYLSIRQTQSNFFGRSTGAGPESGVSFPDFAQLLRGFGLPTTLLAEGLEWEKALEHVLTTPGPQVAVVKLNQDQEFEPRLKSKMIEGRIFTPALDDMYPFLEPAALNEVRQSALNLHK